MRDIDRHLLNRELSWLEFNARVLAQAREPGTPLLERLKFVAISASNLDEFFQVRVAALKNQIEAGISRLSPDGRTPAGQVAEIIDRVREFIAHQEAVLREDLLPALHAQGIELCHWSELNLDERKELTETFERRVFPVLTPLAVDPGHPFPEISSLSLNLGMMVRDPATGDRKFARLKVPQILPRYVRLAGQDRFVPLEQVIAAHLGQLFPGMVIESHWTFRVTRNADLMLDEDEAEDLLETIETELRRRRFGRAVRLEAEIGMSEEMLGLLLDELDLQRDDVTWHRLPLDLTRLFMIHGIDRPSLKDVSWPNAPMPGFDPYATEGGTILDYVRQRDVLVHHPYDSFAESVEAFVAEAADDPRVLSIKTTLYRTSGDSPIIASLVRAAERGVQVAVIVELKARFDEEANISWARTLERAGVHVVYGLVGLKTHAKCVLVVRDDEDGLRRYAHIGTGNYNPRTARTYEDLGLFTANPEICADLGELFNHLTGFSRNVQYRHFLVAPHHLRRTMLELIANEARYGERGEITIKANSLADSEMADALAAAGQAGVQVRMVIRGVCVLRPGVPGRSERVSVRSILGRYLEHSRIFRFANGNGEGEPCYLIGSADLMARNLDRRVEVLTPILAPEHQQRLDQILDALLDPQTRAWELGPDGTWAPTGTQDVQAQFAASAR